MSHDVSFLRPSQAASRRSARPRPTLETLEDRRVPAVGVNQLQATQVVTATAISSAAAFESNYKVFSANISVYQLSNLISAFLNSERNALQGNLLVAQQSALTQAVLQQSFGYVSSEVITFETWFFNATKNNLSAATILTQLDALASSFQATEKAATTLQAQELSTGVTVANNSNAFIYVPPDFISPGNGGVPLPTSTPSIIHPPQLISLMNNDQINQYAAVASAATALTTTSLAADINPSLVGQKVTFTATVAPLSGVGIPTGTVTFNVDGTPQAPVAVVNGKASFALNTLTKGAHTITANYSGDANFEFSSASLSQQVN